MATERNPFDRIPEQETNVVPLGPEIEDIDATFEVAEDGGVVQLEFETEFGTVV